MGNLLTAAEIQKGLLDPKSKSDWLPFFENHEFEKLAPDKRFAIVPIAKGALGPMSVDLTVGNEVYSLRRDQKITLSPESRSIIISPGETVLVLTKEFLAFSPGIAGVTLSRAKLMNEGIALSSAKIDPTWYGCLTIPITNNSRDSFTLNLGERFCTLLLFELGQPLNRELYLTQENTPHLGNQTVQYQPRHTHAWHPRQADTVRDQDMSEVVLSFGPPFDVIQGMFALARAEFKDYINQNVSPNLMRDLKQWLFAEEYQQINKLRETQINILKEHRETEISLLKEQIDILKKNRASQLAQWTTLLLAVVGWLAVAAALLWKLFHP